MKLKLAEYKDGKFERFWNLPDFGYYEDFVSISNTTIDTERAKKEIEAGYKATGFQRDEKDPLSRFDGLFDGITYGQGRFVLEINNCFNIYERTAVFKDFSKLHEYSFNQYLYNTKPEMENLFLKNFLYFYPISQVGNIHQNPELWEKVK